MKTSLLKIKNSLNITALIMSAVMFLCSLTGNFVAFAAENQPYIISQPKCIDADEGDTVSFTVEALGSDLTYNWQHSGNGGSSWTDTPHTGHNTPTMSFNVKSFSYKMLYRCIITDKSGSFVTSDTCKVTNENDILKIVSQTENVYADCGDEVSFSVNTTGTFVRYNWQISYDKGNTWKTAPFTSRLKKTLSFTAQNEYFGCMLRCTVTDYFKNSLVSTPASLIEKNPTKVVLISQPENAEGEIGDTVSFTVMVSGSGITYNWQHSGNGGYTWNDTRHKGHDTATMSFNVKSFSYKMLYRCIITDMFGNVIITDTVTAVHKSQKTFSVSSTDFDTSYSNGSECLANAKDFVDKCVLTDEKSGVKASALYNTNLPVDSNDLIILKITAVSDSSCGELNFSINNGEITADYPVYTQKADYYIPITNTENINSVLITLTSAYQEISITDFQIVNFGLASISNLKTGIYLKDSTETPLAEDDSFGNPSSASVSDGKYLYSVYKGTLTVYNIETETPKTVATLNKIGNCHDIAFINGGKSLVVTSRENGAYFIDISNPLNPIKASEYATLEMATGLATCKEYVFICSRYFGVEVIDASDIYNPKYYSQISNFEEMYDCCVDENYLYVGVWGQKKIQIYDISDLRNPKYTGTILLDGNAGGIDIKDSILCVATGYHNRNDSSIPTSTGFGMGNGIEIYDVSNAKNPVWLSSCKIDGRYKYTGNDYWKVKISGNYAIFASTYNGAYIYDISTPNAPVRINHIPIIIEKTSPNYKTYATGNYIFNFDTSLYNQAPLLSIATSENKLFLGDTITGIYQISLTGANAENAPTYTLAGSDAIPVSVPAIDGYTSSIYTPGYSVYTAKEANGLIYVGCSAGIQVLSNDLELLTQYKTDCPVKDIVVSKDGKYLYTAECEAGVGIYSINNENIEKLSTATTSNKSLADFTVTSLSLSSDENFLLCQAGFSRLGTVDVRNKNTPVLATHTAGGTMYYRNLCPGLIDDKYNAVADSGKLTLYSEGLSALEKSIQLTNTVSSETNGMTAHGSNIISVYSNGYIYFNPETETSSLKTLTVHKIKGVILKGKPSAYGNIMVVSNCPNGEFTIVDISDIDNPVLIANVKTENTSLDIASITDNCILIPMRNSGLLKLNKEV